MTPFVGREAELDEIQAVWQEVCGGQAAGIVISGEAGVGKSRLLAEFTQRIAAVGSKSKKCASPRPWYACTATRSERPRRSQIATASA